MIDLEVVMQITQRIRKQKDPGVGVLTSALNYITSNLDYTGFLEQKGLNWTLGIDPSSAQKSCDRFQALVGLKNSDGSSSSALEFMRTLVAEQVGQVGFSELKSDVKSLTQHDAKSLAQQRAQELKYPISYAVERRPDSLDHTAVFQGIVRVGRRSFGPVEGRSKKDVEVKLARLVLDALGVPVLCGNSIEHKSRESTGSQLDDRGILIALLTVLGPRHLQDRGALVTGDPRVTPLVTPLAVYSAQ